MARSVSLLLLLLLPAAPARAAQEELVDGIAALVGSHIVMISDVMRTIAPQEEAMRKMGAPEQEIGKLRADGLERMIENRLIQAIVERHELFATDEEVTHTIESIARENGLSNEQLYASVTFHGLTIDEYRMQIKRDLERRTAVNAAVGSQIDIEESQVRDLYEVRFANQRQGGEAVHLRQIVVSYGGLSKRTPEVACAAVAAARARIDAGEPFVEVAADVSEVAPRDGGDIGIFHLDDLADWMRNALIPLAPGQISDVLELPFGCSLLQLVERRAFEPVTFEQARDRLSQELWQRQMDEAYRSWIEELRAETYIDRRGYFADAAVLGAPAPAPPEPQRP